MRTVSIVVPFYNEEKCISFFFERMYPVINNIKDSMFEIVCVDDGSIDETLEILKKYQIEDPRIKIVELSRNFGKESALTAGMSLVERFCLKSLDPFPYPAMQTSASDLLLR